MMSCKIFVRHITQGQKAVVTKIFGKYLIITNTVSSGVLMGLGDIMQQTNDKYQGRKTVYDWTRTGRMCFTGILFGPIVHFWYTGLDRYFPGKQPKTVLKKILADQLLASPVFMLLFFMGMGKLEGNIPQESFEEFKEKFPFTYLVECFFWPPAQALNFFLLPPHLRVVYVNALILVWDSFLSYVKHSDEPLPSIRSIRSRGKDMP